MVPQSVQCPLARYTHTLHHQVLKLLVLILCEWLSLRAVMALWRGSPTAALRRLLIMQENVDGTLTNIFTNISLFLFLSCRITFEVGAL